MPNPRNEIAKEERRGNKRETKKTGRIGTEKKDEIDKRCLEKGTCSGSC